VKAKTDVLAALETCRKRQPGLGLEVRMSCEVLFLVLRLVVLTGARILAACYSRELLFALVNHAALSVLPFAGLIAGVLAGVKWDTRRLAVPGRGEQKI
jgi:hypothetical protein